MFLGWYDPDKKKPASEKLSEAIERYVEKFGVAPEVCLTGPVDAAELAAVAAPAAKRAKKGQAKRPTLPVRAVSYIPRWTFYVGVEDEPEPALAAA